MTVYTRQTMVRHNYHIRVGYRYEIWLTFFWQLHNFSSPCLEPVWVIHFYTFHNPCFTLDTLFHAPYNQFSFLIQHLRFPFIAPTGKFVSFTILIHLLHDTSKKCLHSNFLNVLHFTEAWLYGAYRYHRLLQSLCINVGFSFFPANIKTKQRYYCCIAWCSVCLFPKIHTTATTTAPHQVYLS